MRWMTKFDGSTVHTQGTRLPQKQVPLSKIEVGRSTSDPRLSWHIELFQFLVFKYHKAIPVLQVYQKLYLSVQFSRFAQKVGPVSLRELSFMLQSRELNLVLNKNYRPILFFLMANALSCSWRIKSHWSQTAFPINSETNVNVRQINEFINTCIRKK